MTRARLPSDPCDLLREVGPEPVPEPAFERMALRLEATLAAAGTAGVAPGALATPTAGSPRGLSGALSSPAVSLPLVFALGVAAGAAGMRELRGDSELVPSVMPPAALVSAAPKLELPSAAPIRVEATPLAVPSGSGRSMVATSSLSLERGLLDRARAKMAAGDPEAALAVLTQHARSYPRGLLSEEREAMAVNALVALGRAPEARRRGRAFHERYPSSLVRRSVEAALATLAPSDSE
jgi:hypothetical protein